MQPVHVGSIPNGGRFCWRWWWWCEDHTDNDGRATSSYPVLASGNLSSTTTRHTAPRHATCCHDNMTTTRYRATHLTALLTLRALAFHTRYREGTCTPVAKTTRRRGISSASTIPNKPLRTTLRLRKVVGHTGVCGVRARQRLVSALGHPSRQRVHHAHTRVTHRLSMLATPTSSVDSLGRYRCQQYSAVGWLPGLVGSDPNAGTTQYSNAKGIKGFPPWSILGQHIIRIKKGQCTLHSPTKRNGRRSMRPPSCTIHQMSIVPRSLCRRRRRR